jgi:hypothetical protein
VTFQKFERGGHVLHTGKLKPSAAKTRKNQINFLDQKRGGLGSFREVE